MRAFMRFSVVLGVGSWLLATGGCSVPEREVESCGDGVVQVGEVCDGNCPVDCNDGNACTLDGVQGHPSTCDARCVYEEIEQCRHGDGCCPKGCSYVDDADCPTECGNGQVEPGEICDRDCPTDCDDGNACTTDTLSGSAENCNAVCGHQLITACVPGDGCCPAGCNALADDDCSASCGNGTIEDGETCDGNCPVDCNDGNACTVDSLTGSAANCSAACSHPIIQECVSGDGCCPVACSANTDSDCSASCGNGVIEDGETCDGDCPLACDDGNACSLDSLTGSAANCSAACVHQTVYECVSGDGCCPAGCNSVSDSDCSASCGNGVVEDGESCDGNCPVDCNDGNACTVDSLTGSAANCSAVCVHQTVHECVSGDGCCPAGCNSVNDSDCSASCGNGVVEDGETCDGDCPTDCDDADACTDDSLIGSAGNCSAECIHPAVQVCASGDGCCPAGCTDLTDSDCPSQGCPANPVTIYQIQDEGHVQHAGEGCEVVVHGAVITSQVFSAGGEDSFYAQDPSGGRYSGLYVYGDGLDASGLQIGDVVSISGVHTEYYGMTEIVAQTVVRTGSRTPLTPALVSPAQVGDAGYEPEAWEGVFVQVDAVETTLTPFLSDNGGDYGDFLVAAAGGAELVVGWQMRHAFACPQYEQGETCNTDYRQLGQDFDAIQGVMNYSFSHYRLQPRSIADLDFDGTYDAVRLLLKESLNHTVVSYDSARYAIYSSIDNQAGQVEGVYTGQRVATWDIPDPAVMNTEHTWPQSLGPASGPFLSDLHHLFPTVTSANSARSNHPFGWVYSNITWSSGGSLKGSDVVGSTVFEVRPEHRGDTARAKFYIAVCYDLSIPATEEATLRQWHAQDPPDSAELSRNTAVEQIQRNRNPFVDDPDLVDAIVDF